MAPKPQGWKLIQDPKTKIHTVRFRHLGRRIHRSTGETDNVRALVAAARIYEEETTSGERSKVGGRAPALPLLVGAWLSAYSADHSEETIDQYKAYARVQWIPRFKSLPGITNATLADYSRARLRVVKATTVRKELSALRGFLAWCVERHILPEAPIVPSIPKRATGVTSDLVGEQVRVKLTPEQAEAILKALPEVARFGHRVRDLYTVMWETGLRIGTLRRLESPKHYRKGVAVLQITADIDKSRYARELPITPRAAAALDRCVPKARAASRLIFGAVVVRETLRQAAETVLPKDLAKSLSNHDFRHGSATHMVSRSSNLAGAGYLLGHKHASTTSLYVHAAKSAAEEVLAARSKRPSGTKVGTKAKKRAPKKRPNATKKKSKSPSKKGA